MGAEGKRGWRMINDKSGWRMINDNIARPHLNLEVLQCLMDPLLSTC